LSSLFPTFQREYRDRFEELDAEGEDAVASLLSSDPRVVRLLFWSLLYSTRLPYTVTPALDLESIKIIGQGASSTYYRANVIKTPYVSPDLPNVVALRVSKQGYPSGLTWQDLTSELLLRMSGELSVHPNIVQLLFMIPRPNTLSGPPVFAYEFAELGDMSSLLHHRASRQSPLGPKVMADLCLDIGNAITSIHKFGITHNDIK
jgi:serine/threonine protein kinase